MRGCDRAHDERGSGYEVWRTRLLLGDDAGRLAAGPETGHVAGMARRPSDPNEYEPPRQGFPWGVFFKSETYDRHGIAAILEAAIFFGAAGFILWNWLDFFRSGSVQSLVSALFVSLLTFWPFIRRRITRGFWD